MKKRELMGVILFFCCSLLGAQAQEIIKSDTVICESCETFSQAQPTDDRYRVVTNRFWANWFVLGNVGGHAFFGDYGTLGGLSEKMSPNFSVGVGKWFTPGIGVKAQFGMSNSKGFSEQENWFTYGDPMYTADGTPYWKNKMRWTNFNINAMFNLSRLIRGYEGKVSDELMNQFILSAGVGTVHQRKIEAQRNEWSGHLELQYSRFFDKEKKFSLDLKAQGMFCQTNFDGIVLKHDGKKSFWWDINAGVSVGFTYYIKKRHWDRCLPGEAPVYNINQTIIMPEQKNDCPEYGTMVFYVFFPNNYSGRNDAPTMVDAPVNAIDYLASGFHTQTKFDNADAVAKLLNQNQSLARLRTSDISVDEDEVMGSGYEMSDKPISLSMEADSMQAFKEKNGYYYAPIYHGANVWNYRVDHATASQRLLKLENYKDNQSYALNARGGMDIVQKNMRPDADAELFSFADVYGAIENREGHVAQASDDAAVQKIQEIFAKRNVLY
ncbi:MAG: hypothetical protein UHS50_07560, partial [Bacteroidaceae bacterium]|nr:hypothetical protein [Bacteroidaceae bacterium]